ncbi:Alpha/beta hydrolase family protein [Thalassoglobus neptunius]|uniref:Alpha/beta hydrolase family protein n=1 Tax=Thalassoglobus neptunius TaxID=1938619 RepID=A0A5C5WGB2_9PLAN|nr:alpha/beta hydrolase [Thalassoglobus neptunius]TWT49836.1 Alpha/beta hydrolase family protein [Thalassoglobus neptunius]
MTETSHTKTSPESTDSEPCPTPLDWQDVVRAFLEERREGEIPLGQSKLTATQIGQGPPLVLLPASGCSAKIYALLAWLLREERQLWILSEPEFERTPSAKKLIPETATSYCEAIRELFGGPVDVYAPTLSSQIALQMMIDGSDFLKNVVLQSAWAHRRLNWTETALAQAGLLLPFSIRRLPLWLSSQVANHRPWFPPYDETRFGFLLSETYRVSVRQNCRKLLAADRTNLSAEVSQVNNRVLLLRTEGDGASIDREEDRLEKNLPNCEVEWMHTSGHFPFLTHPHRLVKILRAFLERASEESHEQRR